MHTEIAGLSVEVFQATQTAPTAAVIFCHGFGAPGDDLVGLAPELVRAVPALRDVRFYFPAAPLTLEMGFGDSRAWWLIDMGAIQKLAHDPAAQREFRTSSLKACPRRARRCSRWCKTWRSTPVCR